MPELAVTEVARQSGATCEWGGYALLITALALSNAITASPTTCCSVAAGDSAPQVRKTTYGIWTVPINFHRYERKMVL
jgi:hypothetical protein